jgi:hypothetical protein
MVFALFRLPVVKVLNPTFWGGALSSLGQRLKGEPSAAAAAKPRSPEPAPSQTPSTAAPRATLPAQAERELELRPAEVRARFDALFDRMLALEDTLDALGKRFALRGVHDRRAEQRTLDRIDALAEAIERRNLELEAQATVLTRIEQRLDRIERRRLEEQSEADDPESSRTHADELAERVERRTTDARRLSRNAPDDAPELWDVAPFSTSSMRGNLAEVSLPTILGMLELERQSGVLKVCADDGAIVSATLCDGALVGARVRELDIEPVDAIREALRFKRGHFWFRQLGVEVAMGPPKSVGSVLLEASRQNDEALRSA